MRRPGSSFSSLLLCQQIHFLVMASAAWWRQSPPDLDTSYQNPPPNPVMLGMCSPHENFLGHIHTVAVGPHLEHLSNISVLPSSSSGTLFFFLSFPNVFLYSPLYKTPQLSAEWNTSSPVCKLKHLEVRAGRVLCTWTVHLEFPPTTNLIQRSSSSYLIWCFAWAHVYEHKVFSIFLNIHCL